ncbi:MAG: phosphotransferase [Woeseiaceae bacterium]
MDGLAAAAVAAVPPAVSLPRVQRAVHEQFGLVGTYRPLISERDQNFRLTTASGADYVVKVTSSAEPPLVSDFQIAGLLHLEQSETAVPRVIRTLKGNVSGHLESGQQDYRLRVVSYVPGAELASLALTSHLAFDFGARLAHLDAQLGDFAHPGDRPTLLWDLQRALELRELLDHIDDTEVRRPAEQALHDYEEFVAPHVAQLRTQVIHGDANPGNVIVDPVDLKISGFIDFGDMVRAPLIFDVAIAAAYLRGSDARALELVAPFIDGYNHVVPLQALEQTLLFDLIRARLATTITLLYWRLGARPGDDPYREKTLKEEADAVRFLGALDSLGRAGFRERIAARVGRRTV